MKPIESLKARLSNDKLLVQNEKGFLSTVGFEWNPAATDKEIAEFETVLHHQLPAEFKEFLKISNGATFFKDLDYGQWGFHILSLAELSEIQSKVTTRGYDLKPEWLPFVTCLGDCDILLFDLKGIWDHNPTDDVAIRYCFFCWYLIWQWEQIDFPGEDISFEAKITVDNRMGISKAELEHTLSSIACGYSNNFQIEYKCILVHLKRLIPYAFSFSSKSTETLLSELQKAAKGNAVAQAILRYQFMYRS